MLNKPVTPYSPTYPHSLHARELLLMASLSRIPPQRADCEAFDKARRIAAALIAGTY